jgi:hypothetical protein
MWKSKANPDWQKKLLIDFNTKCDILADFYLRSKHDKKYANFYDSHDVGLPLGFLLSEKIVEISFEREDINGEEIIGETFDQLCEELGLDPEGEFESLVEMIKLQLHGGLGGINSSGKEIN